MTTSLIGDWIGREDAGSDVVDAVRARRMHALLDRDPAALSAASALPAGYHWLYCNSITRRSEWGEDGHARRGGFLPPLDVSRRMWAGGSLRFLQPLHLGDAVERRSIITSIEEKEGRSGRFHAVRIDHRIHGPGGVAIEEQQNLVYLPATSPPAANAPTFPKSEPEWRDVFTTDEVALFYFSALTMNGHRIHYDYRYATGTEGYRGLLVHAPFTALLMLDAAQRHGSPIREFSYRAIAPLFCGDTITLAGTATQPRNQAWALRPDGSVAMEATFSSAVNLI
ncbi:MAG: MaoC family dehydratase N-terminal domain-containing protein [Gemmatimonadota bacterium]